MSEFTPVSNPAEASARQQALLIRFVRLAFLILFTTVTLLAILKVDTTSGPRATALAIGWPVTVGFAMVVAIVVVLVDVFTPRKKISTLFSVFIGLLGAMLAMAGINVIIDLIAQTYDITKPADLIASIKVLTGIAIAYLSITTVLQTQDDFRLVIPYVEFAKQLRGPRPLLLDSSALIDARIVEVVQTGLLQQPIVVPRAVLLELQTLADSAEKLKRARGRRGLEMVARLQRLPGVDVQIDESNDPGKPVDQMLVDLARVLPATVVTTDSGLSRMAKINGVAALNMHELAAALRPSLLPGEQFRLRLVRPGEQPGQGVGYLDDGTMVVAEDGAPLIGHEATLIVVSALQTGMGRLIFAKVASGSAEHEPRHGTPGAGGPVHGADESAIPVFDGPHAGVPEPLAREMLRGEMPASGGPTPAVGATDVTRLPAEIGQKANGEPPVHEAPTSDPQTASTDARRSPYPPKPPRSLRGGTPRNPRR